MKSVLEDADGQNMLDLYPVANVDFKCILACFELPSRKNLLRDLGTKNSG